MNHYIFFNALVLSSIFQSYSLHSFYSSLANILGIAAFSFQQGLLVIFEIDQCFSSLLLTRSIRDATNLMNLTLHHFLYPLQFCGVIFDFDQLAR